MSLFFDPNIAETLILCEEESRHFAKVLRGKVGDRIDITDGKNNLYTVEVIDNHHKGCKVKIINEVKNIDKRDFKIHLAIAPTKNIDRIEWCVEKAIEIGVDEISFLQCERSERKVIKLERVNRIALSALKQSQKYTYPIINELTKLNQFLTQEKDSSSTKLIAHLADNNRQFISDFNLHTQTICILIGPEGDFSPNEVEKAFDAGFKAVSLGDYRLRTETAGVAACHEIHVLNRIKA